MNIIDWKNEAAAQLCDPNRNIADDYRQALERQRVGKCLNCGLGNANEFTDDDQMVQVRFDCGHSHKGLRLTESIGIHESLKATVVPVGKGKRHFVFQLIQGWFKSVNHDLPKGVNLLQLIDKRNNRYQKKVVDAADENNVIKDQNESLTDHQGYGSTKVKK